MDFQRISELFDASPNEVKSKYYAWCNEKRKKSTVLNPDLKLLSYLSGLSATSISNFLNRKKGSVSKEKADKLEKLIELTGYLPSAAAKKLRSVKKMSIAFISPITDSPNPRFYTEILKGVKKEAKKYGFYIDIYDVAENEEEDFFNNMPFLGMVDALIIVSSKMTSEPLSRLVQRNIPVVLVHPWRKVEEAPIVNSIIPDTEVFTQLLDHLFTDCKYRRPVLISLHPKNHIIRNHKIELFKKALHKNNIPFDSEKNLFIIERHTFSEGKRAYRESILSNPEMDVFICLSDIVAASICREMEREKREIAVTGYDNSDIGELFNLITIDQKMEETGRIAFEKLFYAIKHVMVNKKLPDYSNSIVPLELIIRTSSIITQNPKKRS